VNWPELCIGVCTYKRPMYAALVLNVLNTGIHYYGPVRFHIADGGSPSEDIDVYKTILRDRNVSVEVTDNLADMCNSCARHGGDFWMTIMDDYLLRQPINVTPDVGLLMQDESIGVVRMSRLSFWGSGRGPETSGDLVTSDSCLHWWKLDKSRSKDPYMSSIGAHLYHRRFWDFYGDIPSCPPNIPGQAELNGNERFWRKGVNGPTVAIPMRFGEDSEERKEPFWHIGTWRTDEYKSTAGSRL
jgi:hypothetical protein